MVRPIGNARKLNASPDDTWGLHIVDVNLELGDLQRAVAGQTRTYLTRSASPAWGSGSAPGAGATRVTAAVPGRRSGPRSPGPTGAVCAWRTSARTGAWSSATAASPSR